MEIPAYVNEIISQLEAAGHEAWCVGGCVRDSLLGRAPSDWDIASSAGPDETAGCFPSRRLVEAGRQHGTVGVICGGGVVEITTYRVEGAYRAHRRPESVSFSHRLEDDLSRRDFTVNAMAYHPRRGLRDLFGGEADLRARLLRCVGNPRERFDEDALRILRCLRFAAVLGFEIEQETRAAALSQRRLVGLLSPERVREELTKLLCSPSAAKVLGGNWDILLAALPELIGCDPARALSGLATLPQDPELRWAALLAGHTEPQRLLERLRFSRRNAGEALALWSHRNEPLPICRRRVKDLLGEMGGDGFFRLLELLRAIRPAEQGFLKEAEASALELLARGECLSLSGLAVKGGDLLAAGFTPNEELGAALARLLDEVLDDKLPNQREALIRRAQELRQHRTIHRQKAEGSAKDGEQQE